MANNVITTTEIRDSISKYDIKDEMDRLFGQEDVSAVINAGFEKTKKQLEHAVSLFPSEYKEYANTVIEKNGMYLIVDFSDNIRFVFERVFQRTLDFGLKHREGIHTSEHFYQGRRDRGNVHGIFSEGSNQDLWRR